MWDLPHTTPERAAILAFGLYCLFPYTANFVSQPLAETPTLFAMCLALWLAMRALRSGSWWEWLGCALATTCVVLLRPDGGLLLVTLLLYLAWRRAWKPAVLLVMCTALALTPWTMRNHRVFGVWQPLVPGNATDPGESFPQGFTDWTKTWLGEFCSVYEIAWNVPGEEIDAGLLPARAFDSEVQKQRTLELISEYNTTQQVTAELDTKFATLARERRSAHPVMYYVGLPVLREVDMWLRPRTDTFPIEVRWWEYWRVPQETAFAVAYAGLGVLVLGAGVLGYVRGRRAMQFGGLLMLYVVLRSAFLLTVATSEPRYTIECWPMVLVGAGVWVASRFSPRAPSAP